MSLTTVQLDAVGGIAGDMFVAAMIDALPELRVRVLADAIAVLGPGIGTPVLEDGQSGGIHCLRFRLSDAHDHRGHHAQHARFGDMITRIESAALSPGTAVQAAAMLRLLAEAEAAIHGVPLEQVHFHEIGDWDSLVDVVAAGSIAAALPDARWMVSDLPRGGGLVRTQHGLLPVPAPATARLLKGFGWRDDGIAGERVTPTGAAILRHLVAAGSRPDVLGRLRSAGTGAGTRDLPGLPNVLRATIFDGPVPLMEQPAAERIAVMSFDIDDMTGEEIGIAADRLRHMPEVRDLVIHTGIGKKGRPLHSFRLLLQPDDQETVAAACFFETSTLGLRWRVEHRAVLPRRFSDHDSGSATVRVKSADHDGRTRRKAESDDLIGTAGLEARRALKRQAEDAS